MDIPNSPSLYKELIIEYFKEKCGIGFFEDASLSNISNYCMLDSAALDVDGGLQASSVFNTCPDSMLARPGEDDRQFHYLEQRYKFCLRDQDLKKGTMRLMDEELKMSGNPKQQEGEDIELKAKYLASYRSERATIRLARPIDYRTNSKKYRFKVYLKTLHYGYADILDEVILSFDYTTSFPHFLETLRQQTVLCTIPPRPLKEFPAAAVYGEVRSPSRETSKTLSIHEEPSPKETAIQPEDSPSYPSKRSDLTNNHIEKQEKVLTQNMRREPSSSNLDADNSEGPEYLLPERQGLNNGSLVQEDTTRNKHVESSSKNPTVAKQEGPISNSTSQTKSGFGPHSICPVQSVDQRGYSLTNGPWRYKIASIPVTPVFTDIRNGVDYVQMLEALKIEASKGSGSAKVVIMHAMDREAWAAWKKIENDENETILRRETNFSREEDDFFDGHNAETYSQWKIRTSGF